MYSGKQIGSVLLGLVFALQALGQTDNITAEAIIQRAIDSSGGEARLDSLHSVEFVTKIITPEKQVLSFDIKRKDFNKYYITTLSNSHISSITVYNNGRAIIIQNDSVRAVTDPQVLEELQLQCYLSIDHGYKKLGYKFTRMDDQRFRNFDCYMVLTESPLGNKTANYYDKRTGRLVMIVYPNEYKTVFVDFYRSEGLTVPSKILLTDKNDNVTQSSLQKLVYNNNLDAYWFHLPGEGKYRVPDIFKTGVFKYVGSNEGAGFSRDRDTQVETNNGKKTAYKIKWDSNSDYLLFRLKNPADPATGENREYIKTKITGWDQNKYYCQYITSDNIGGTCIIEKVE